MLRNGAFVQRKYGFMLVGALLGWVVSIVGGMADSLIAGLYLDANAVAAVELVTPIYSLIFFVAILLSYGAAIVYSTELGAFRVERSQKIAGMGASVSVVLGIVMALLLFVCKQQILAFYACSEAIMVQASEYYDAFIYIALFSPLQWCLYYLVTFDGDETIILINDATIAIANTAVSLTLVGSLGIRGLAIGTLVSNVLGIVLLLPHFFKKSNSIRFKLHFSFADLWEMFKRSSAYSSTTLYVAVIDLVMNKVIIEFYSDAYIPAYTVVNVVLNFAAVLSCAVNAGATLITVAYGEDNPNAIRRVMKLVHRDSVVLGVIFGGLLIAAAPYWAGIYAITDPAVAAAATYAGRLIPISYLISAFVFIYIGYYPLIDKTFAGNLLGVLYMLIGPLVLSIPLGYFFDFNGMTLGFFLTPFFAALFLLVYLLATKQIKGAPLLLHPTDEAEAHFDIKLNTDGIFALQSAAREFLRAQNVAPKLVNEIELIIEEALTHIRERNKKDILCECVFLVNDEHIRMISKDNGRIFNLLEEAEDSADLRCYVMARVMESAKERSNTTTSSFNRNTFIWMR